MIQEEYNDPSFINHKKQPDGSIFDTLVNLILSDYIRPSVFCTLLGLFLPPFLNLFMVSAEQNFRHLPSPEFFRPGIYRRCQEIILERISQGRGFIIQHTWQ